MKEAEIVLTRKLAVLHKRKIYGLAEQHSFRSAAIKYLNETDLKSKDRDAGCLKNTDPFLGDLPIEGVHMGSIQPYIAHRKNEGIKSKTVIRELAVIHKILTLACSEWKDSNNKPWLNSIPKINKPNWKDTSKAYPLSFDEQSRLFKLLPAYLTDMSLFKVNTGLREQEVCWLRWDWEIEIPELNTRIFLIPGSKVSYEDGVWKGTKNGEDALVVLNKISRSIIKKQRNKHDTYVFNYNGHRVNKIHSSAWKTAWAKAKLPTNTMYKKGVHNLKHTLGRRLRAMDVPLETRKVLLHHKNGDITTEYSAPEIQELIDALELVAGDKPHKSPTITLIKINGHKKAS